MTSEEAVKIKKLIEAEGGEIDSIGYITGCCVWGQMIKDVQALGAWLFFDDEERKMGISNWPGDLDELEHKTLKFKDFDGEEMEIRLGRHASDHDDVELWKNGERLSSMHIDGHCMFVWPTKAKRVVVHLT